MNYSTGVAGTGNNYDNSVIVCTSDAVGTTKQYEFKKEDT